MTKKHIAISRERAAQLCQQMRDEGKRIIFTNGCFDILHVGHVKYLEQAKSFGDLLIVGINSDRSVKILKGEERPLIVEEERARIIAALHFVDYTVIFDEDTPEQLISEIKPDIHIKGGDYEGIDIPEAKVVRSYGGEVKILPYNKGRSTSGIIDNIVKRYRKGIKA